MFSDWLENRIFWYYLVFWVGIVWLMTGASGRLFWTFGFHDNKTKYVHFTADRNMPVNLKIGFNNNVITNSSYTKLLGVTINNTLSWNNHIDLIMKKLSKVCYIIRNAKMYMSVCFITKSDLLCLFFHSVMSCWIIFWGNSSHSSIIFRIQKKKKRQL